LAVFSTPILPVEAQVPGRATVRGIVVGEPAARPVARAYVFLDDGTGTTADDNGQFLIEGLPPGRYGIAAVSPTCDIAVGVLALEAGERVMVRLEVVPAEGELDSAPVSRVSEPEAPGSSVKVITAADIQDMGARNLFDVIRAAAPNMVGQESPQPGGAATLSGRGSNSATMEQSPLVIIDGFRVPSPPEGWLNSIDPETVARIEILKGSAAAWIHGAGVASGVIRIYTRKTGVSLEPGTDPRACGFSFQRRQR
jgi:outer membrane receptor protein involved in Fe transport